MPFKHVIPTHQGRAAEHILMSIYAGPGKTTLSNTHFDTTRCNAEASGARALDFPSAEAKQRDSEAPFKGNMNIEALSEFLEKNHEACGLIISTITNNAGGGQPVSLENIRATADLAQKYQKPFYLDACRFAENAWFIKKREPGQEDRSLVDIVRECFGLADGMTMSGKKDAFGNIGGWIACNEDSVAEKMKRRLIQTEGFPTYGGLAGRDLEALAVGLKEIVDEDYLAYRVRTNEYIIEKLDQMGVPVIKPAGGHAVFIDAGKWLPHIPPHEYPGHAVACALYELGGIRSCEIGSLMFGRQPDGSEKPAPRELVRLALPRRTYTQSHMDYVVEVFGELVEQAQGLKGFRILDGSPSMRHFTCRLERL